MNTSASHSRRDSRASVPTPPTPEREHKAQVRTATERGQSQYLAYKPSPDNPYTTLPPPTTSVVQLRFQLAHLDGVYRVVQLPLNYTFATLYKLILFMFGWNGMHAHKARVYSFVEMYSPRGKKAGQIKSYGREVCLDEDGFFMQTRFAEYDVVPKGRTEWSPLQDMDDAEERIDDQDLLVSQVWNPNVDENASWGGCANSEMGVIFEYDFGAAWTVHITMDRDDDFFDTNKPTNRPIMIKDKCKGVPPIEDDADDLGERAPSRKTLPTKFFEPNIFARYMNFDVTTYAGQNELEVHEKAS
ncbi:hypothetical protein R3P38DRAFT_3057636 [Favolaschia claudopus]|uniref:Plasmid pRiA4b Orf3-like domain-containing protein n=1 Tax=Favolaschia claudopus TaxID=2862362 RepID=A0AAW0A2S2_9AGAR